VGHTLLPSVPTVEKSLQWEIPRKTAVLFGKSSKNSQQAMFDDTGGYFIWVKKKLYLHMGCSSADVTPGARIRIFDPECVYL